jgi:hypothetical protein
MNSTELSSTGIGNSTLFHNSDQDGNGSRTYTCDPNGMKTANVIRIKDIATNLPSHGQSGQVVVSGGILICQLK